jgi:Cdc6-like AAA superfamily ATPase
MSKKDAILTALADIDKSKFHSDEVAAAAGVSGAVAYGICKQLAAHGQLKKIVNGRKVLYSKIDGATPAPRLKFNIPVADRFEYIEKFTRMVGQGITPSFLLTGQAGVGKTYTVTNVLKDQGLKENDDFVVIKGHSSPLGLYKTLYSHRDQIVVFDDCDSIWKDQVSVNILKAALDSYDVRRISWNSMSAERLDVEPTFIFEGSIIFISNCDANKLDSAVVSRTITANLIMSNDEILDRMEDISNKLETNIPMGTKLEVLNFLRDHQDDLEGLSIRTFIQAIRIRQGNETGWKNMILWTC